MDLLLHRYGGGIEYLMQLPADEGAVLIEQAMEQENKRHAWEMWVSLLPHMKKFIPFDRFYADLRAGAHIKATQGTSLPMSEADILEQAERIKQADLGRGRPQ